MSTYRGRGTKVGFGVEASWGAGASRTNWHHTMSSSNWTEKIVRIQRPYLANAGAELLPKSTSTIDVGSDVAPSIKVPLRYRGMGLLMKALFGSAVDAGAGPFTHTFGLASPDDAPSLAGEHVRGSSGTSDLAVGLVASKATFDFPPRNIATAEIEFIGKSLATRGAAGSATDGDLVEVLGSQVGSNGSVGFNGGLYPCKSLKVVVDRAISSREQLGTTSTGQPKATGLTKVTITAVIDAEDALYTAYRAMTSADLTFTATGTGNDALSVTAENAVIMEYDDTVKDQGIVEATVTWEARVDATGTGGFTMIFTNDDSSWDAN